jgi:predicted unusual protein kinase regulating ubiquinone biosynthesis (AarF/ABC1/UbiB family)
MSYEPGVSLRESPISNYQKDKIVNLYHLFIRNNQVITNYNHGDLHPGNWKVRLDPKDLNHKLVIHDFGYCWRIPVNLFAKIGTIFADTFEESSNNVETSIDNLCELTYWSVLYNKPDKETEYKVKIREHVVNEIRIRNITELSVIDSLKATIIFCNKENLLLDPTLIQCYIIFIQGQKLFEQYDLMKGDKDDTTPYEVFRERYLNIYTFCKTYNIFPKYSKNIENKLILKLSFQNFIQLLVFLL